MRRSRRVRPVGIACAAGLVSAFALAFEVAPHVALLLAPAVALVLFLLFGLYPGEDLIERLRARRRPARLRAALRVGRPVGAPRVRRVGGAFAFALAMRPPPAVLPA
jgi:hypothetical protein